MIDKKTLEDIIEVVDRKNIKILFCGDPFQLPPVKEAMPSVCNLQIKEIKLFDVVRYDGKLAQRVRAMRSESFRADRRRERMRVLVCRTQTRSAKHRTTGTRLRPCGRRNSQW